MRRSRCAVSNPSANSYLLLRSLLHVLLILNFINHLITITAEIKATIKQAELNRGIAHQIHEHQTRRLQNLIKDSELDEKVLENLFNLK